MQYRTVTLPTLHPPPPQCAHGSYLYIPDFVQRIFSRPPSSPRIEPEGLLPHSLVPALDPPLRPIHSTYPVCHLGHCLASGFFTSVLQTEMFCAFLVSPTVLSLQLGGRDPDVACYVIFSVSVMFHGSSPIFFWCMVYGRTEGISVCVNVRRNRTFEWNATNRLITISRSRPVRRLRKT